MSKIRAGALTTHVQRLDADPAAIKGAKQTVVFIHGLLTDSLASYYFTLGPAFAKAGIDVIMYDLRGHGRSDRPATGYHLEEYVEDLDALLGALAVDCPVHLVGNSFGGSIAFGLAQVHPERVASVVAIEAEPPIAIWLEHMAKGLADAKTRLVHDEVIAWISANHGAHTARLSKAAGKLLQVTTMAEDIPNSRAIDDDLTGVDCPVLAIFGGDSGLSGQVHWLESTLERCRTVVLPDQGHSVLVERTNETRDIILDWVADHQLVEVDHR